MARGLSDRSGVPRANGGVGRGVRSETRSSKQIDNSAAVEFTLTAWV
jgi:hypothetical protein